MTQRTIWCLWCLVFPLLSGPSDGAQGVADKRLLLSVTLLQGGGGFQGGLRMQDQPFVSQWWWHRGPGPKSESPCPDMAVLVRSPQASGPWRRWTRHALDRRNGGGGGWRTINTHLYARIIYTCAYNTRARIINTHVKYKHAYNIYTSIICACVYTHIYTRIYTHVSM